MSSDIFEDRDALIRIWENERKSRDLCATLMWENVKYFGSLFGALLVAHMALLAFFWPKDHSAFPSVAKESILIFPATIILLSIYAELDPRKRWDRFLLVVAQLLKIEGILGLHKDISEKLTLFKKDEFLFKDYQENIKYKNSDVFRKEGRKFTLKIEKLNMYISMRIIYWITIALAVGLLIMDLNLLNVHT